jgi:hypothetical protein
MSKKKGKPAARTASKNKPAGKPSKQAIRLSRSPSRAIAEPSARTSQITIFIFRTGNGIKIRTSPQHAFAGPGHVEWTVVNLVDGSDVPVTISWPDAGPWGKERLEIKGMLRKSADDAAHGRFKYVVTGLGAQEDPEIEIPEM